MSKAEKENMIRVLTTKIEELEGAINNYIKIERKIYIANGQAGYSVSDTPFYLWTDLLVNKELPKRITSALNNVDELEKFKELEKLEKELLEEKAKIELPNSRWKNAKRYQESNNPELQIMVDESLSPFTEPLILKNLNVF